MGYFTKFRHHYTEPERYTPAIARERKLAAVLEREREFVAPLASLSQVNKKSDAPRWKLNDVTQQTSHKAAKIAAALSLFRESDFADAAKREQYRNLRRQQEAVRYRQAQQRAKPAGADNRQFNPTPGPRTIYGTYATHSRRTSLNWLPMFDLARAVVPCIDRAVRREVMFALGKAGRGYRTPHRRNQFSGIPC